jgi:dTDP-4-amino-4,6-dideoxygalactose transaminase
MRDVPLARPKLGLMGLLADAYAISKSGTLTGGRFLSKFEEVLKEYLDVSNVVAVSSATTALECAIASIANSSKDEILVADFSFPATANSVAWLGLKPVLVDSKPNSFSIDLEHASRLLTGNSRALITVDPFGMSSDFKAISEFCKENKLVFIEDAACAIGSTYQGKKLGTFGDLGCISFHPRKLLTTGEGGAITSDSNVLAEAVKKLRSHGAIPREQFFEFEEIGTNARLSEIPASIGIRQLKKLDSEIRNRKKVYQLYKDLLQECKDITFPEIPEGLQWNYQSMVVLTTSNEIRNHIVKVLRAEKIGATLGTYAAHTQPSFANLGYKAGDLPNSFKFQETSLTLPMFGDLSASSVKRICDLVKRALKE